MAGFQDKFSLAIEQFVQETKSDIALAMYYLQNTDFNIDKALEQFNSNEHRKVGDFTVPLKDVFHRLSKFEVLSWNIEGTTSNESKLRIARIVKTIEELEPEIIFMQEVVQESYDKFNEELTKRYKILPEFDYENKRYFSLIMVDNRLNLGNENATTVPLSGSLSKRNFLTVTVKINDSYIKLITAHMESCDSSDIRKDQLKQLFNEMRNDTDYAIFAGDTNLRDQEVKEIGGIPSKIVDVWEHDGANKVTKSTWDPKRNLNAEITCPHGKPSRFDRMYFYSNQSEIGDGSVMPYKFGLEGLEKVHRGSRFPSDHWAIMGYFYID